MVFDDIDRNSPNNSFEMTSREYGDFSQREDNDEHADQGSQHEDHYSNRVHSVHRNRLFKSHDHLILGHEARVGGTGVRTLGRNRNSGKSINWEKLDAEI